MLRHRAVPSANVDQDRVGRIEGGPVVIGGQVLDIERLAFGHELHALTEPFGALGLVREELVQREIRVVADAVGRLIRFAGIGESDQGFGKLIEGGCDFAGPHAHVGEKIGVLDHHAADGGVSDLVGGGFSEDAVGHGVAEEAIDEGFGKRACFGDFGIGGGAIDGYGFMDIVRINYAQRGDIGRLPLLMEILSVFCMGCQIGTTHAVQDLGC